LPRCGLLHREIRNDSHSSTSSFSLSFLPFLIRSRRYLPPLFWKNAGTSLPPFAEQTNLSEKKRWKILRVLFLVSSSPSPPVACPRRTKLLRTVIIERAILHSSSSLPSSSLPLSLSLRSFSSNVLSPHKDLVCRLGRVIHVFVFPPLSLLPSLLYLVSFPLSSLYSCSGPAGLRSSCSRISKVRRQSRRCQPVVISFFLSPCLRIADVLWCRG